MSPLRPPLSPSPWLAVAVGLSLALPPLTAPAAPPAPAPAPPPPEGPWWRERLRAWWETVDGAELTLSTGAALLSASAREGSFTEGRVAQGAASLSTLSLSLYSDPRGGWQWSPAGGVGLVSSDLSDLERPVSSPNRGRGELVDVVCQRFEPDGELVGSFGDCRLNNSYSLTLLSASLGAWGGYQWRLRPTPSLEAHAELGADWRPLSLRWTHSELGGVRVNDEWSWSWLGAARAVGVARVLWGRWGVGGAASLEWTPAIALREPVEFRGADVCGALSCSRERVLVDRLALLAWSVSLHLIYRWSR